MKLTEEKAYELYDDMLNELYPLDGCSCSSFSTLLAKGDPKAYYCGFGDFCCSREIELV